MIRVKRVNRKKNCSLDILILRKVLNSLVTGCVSYFAASLTLAVRSRVSPFGVSPFAFLRRFFLNELLCLLSGMIFFLLYKKMLVEWQ